MDYAVEGMIFSVYGHSSEDYVHRYVHSVPYCCWGTYFMHMCIQDEIRRWIDELEVG